MLLSVLCIPVLDDHRIIEQSVLERTLSSFSSNPPLWVVHWLEFPYLLIEAVKCVEVEQLCRWGMKRREHKPQPGKVV